MKEPAQRLDSKALERKIVDEVVAKAEDYESNMASYMANVGEWGELFKVSRPVRKANTFSNPRLTEFYRASNAIATLMYRMQTAQEPFFDVVPMELGADYSDVEDIRDTLLAQLRYSEYRRYLLKANMYVVPFGTVVCQEDYGVYGINPFGRRLPLTTFRPRMMDQVLFDRGAMELADADWMATSDLTSPHALSRLAEDDQATAKTWFKSALQAAAKDDVGENDINPYVLARLQRAGMKNTDEYRKRREILLYHGKFDGLNDGVEYVAGVVNRKILVRFHANNFQHGRRPLRVGKWVDFDAPYGIGLGHLFGSLHKSMDANRQKAQDNISMAAYNMWKRRRGSVNDEDLVIQPQQIIDVDEANDLTPLGVDVQGAEAALKLEELMKQEFRAGSGATDTLQAIITEATASEVSLAQNEALRNISVKAEQIAESLVREHLEVCHYNNAQYIKQAFNINKGGVARRVYPAKLRCDVDFALKLTTDRDFKPQRLKELLQMLQILVSTKSSHPDQVDISIKPVVKAIAHMLDVPPEEIVRPPLSPLPMGASEMAGMASVTLPGPGGPGSSSGPAILESPSGPVLGSPA